MIKKTWLIVPFVTLSLILPAYVALAPNRQISQNLVSNTLSKQQVVSLIDQDVVLAKIAFCESGYNIEAIGRAGEIGLLQFMPSTWELWTKKMNKDLNINNTEHQIEVYHWALKQGYANHWTCWRKLFAITR